MGAVWLLVLIFASLYGFVRTGLGFRLLQSSKRSADLSPPEPMV